VLKIAQRTAKQIFKLEYKQKGKLKKKLCEKKAVPKDCKNFLMIGTSKKISLREKIC